MSDVRPALVDLVLTKCDPGVAAYHATILDLAARGFLEVSNGPDGLRVTPPGLPRAADGLAGFEQQVLGAVRTRLMGADDAPFGALAAACSDDVKNIWEPFLEKLLDEGRRLGICRKRPWARSIGLLFLMTIPVAILAALVPIRVWHVGIAAAVVISVVSVFVFWWLLENVGGTHTLTDAGQALAAGWKRERASLAACPFSLDPASLERFAFAVAARAQAAPATPGAAGLSRRAVAAAAGPPQETREPPREIWSSFSGTWRRVTPESTSGLGSGGAEPGMMFSLAGITLGLAIVPVLMAMSPGTFRWIGVPLAPGLVATAAVLIVLGMGTVSRRAALPKTAMFDGQVIARWQERVENENGASTAHCSVIDDGRRAWLCSLRHVYDYFAVGDLVQVTYSPRTGDLQKVRLSARPRTEQSGNPG
jgi:hypothetical protein